MANLDTNTTVVGTLLQPKIASTTKENQYIPRTGIGFPFKKNPGKSYVQPNVEISLARSNLKQLLSTAPGERVMLPAFGCDLESLLFEPFDENLVVEARARILTSISNYIPYVKVNRLKIYRQEESTKYGLPTLIIKLSCQIREDENTQFEVDVSI
jgi:phage baseplate assembly protein W